MPRVGPAENLCGSLLGLRATLMDGRDPYEDGLALRIGFLRYA